MHELLESLDGDLIRKYEQIRSPYYTTYPTGGEWDSDFKHKHYLNALKHSTSLGQKVPLALYIHFPFCPELCYYCCCIKTISKNRERITVYLDYLHREIDLLLSHFDDLGVEPDVREIHFGGGTPTYMKRHEFEGLLKKLRTFVDLKNLDECTLEIDPRTVTTEDMHYYLQTGVNRISFGIQDFDPKVQKAINRIQPYKLIEPLVTGKLKQCSVSFDLIYGLPFSTKESFRETLSMVKQLDPDRLAVYNYDHTPDIHKGMRAIQAKDLPDLEEKTLMYVEGVTDLLGSGYDYVGIDHFAKSTDNLAKAYKNKSIWRNLNGYTTERNYNFELGLGNSSISSFDRYYVQSIKKETDYYQSIDNQSLPVLRGRKLTDDDVIRRDLILTILCHHYADYSEFENKYGIRFNEYFEEELKTLQELENDGFVEIGEDFLKVTGLGKIFVHHVCKSFDKYLNKNGEYMRTHAAIIKEQTASNTNFV